MRKLFLLLVSWIPVSNALSQTFNTDSLRDFLSKSKDDTTTLRRMSNLAEVFVHSHPDSSYYFGRQEYLLAGSRNNKNFEFDGLVYMCVGLRQMGNYPKALEYGLQALKLSEQLHNQQYITYCTSEISEVYYFQKDGKNCIAYALKALDSYKGPSGSISQLDLYQQISEAYELMKIYDSSLFYQQKCYQKAVKLKNELEIEYCYENLADAYFEMNQDSLALVNYRLALPYFISHKVDEGTCEAAQYLAQIFDKRNKPDSARWYGQFSLRIAQASMLTSRQSDATDFLVSFYKKRHQSDSALKYLELSVVLKDSMFNEEKLQEMQNLTFDENNRQQEIQEEKKKEHEASVRNLQLIAIAIFIPVFFLFVLFLARIKVKARLIEFLAIIDLLLFFEFITDLIFPYISNWTNDRPIGEMLILVLIAAALEPLNFAFENWVKKHLVHKQVAII
jgi:hypothetical protein